MTLGLEGVTRIVGGETHIAEVNLELEPGSLNLLLGPTRSGKTSLMHLMAGLDRPTEGRVAWTPTGTNESDYPKLAQLWWLNIGEAVSGEVTVDSAMDNLAREQDKVLTRRRVAAPRATAAPSSTTRSTPRSGPAGPARPRPSWPTGSREGETVDYDGLLQAWREARVR